MTLINDHECNCADVKCCTCEQEQAEARRESRDRENREKYEARGEW